MLYTLKFTIIIPTALCCYRALLCSICPNYIIIYSNYKLIFHVFIDLSRQNEALTQEKKGEEKKILASKIINFNFRSHVQYFSKVNKH